jgi:hypothetical protein
LQGPLVPPGASFIGFIASSAATGLRALETGAL